MKLKLLRFLWIFDLFISLVIVVFFFIGIMDGSVSSFNIELWLIILFVLAVLHSGSFWLKTQGYILSAIILLLVLAIPGLLFGLFMLLILLSQSPWN